MKLPYIAAVAVFAAIVAGCGGGGGGSSVAPGAPGGGGSTATTPPVTTSVNRPVTLSIVIPKGVTTAQSIRGKQYIPSNTGSMTLTLVSVNGVATTGAVQGPFNLTAPSPTNPNPACAVVTAGTACTFSISAPAGTDIFTATTYSDAKGTIPLGSGSVAFSVSTNATNTANLTLAGPVASVSLLASSTSLSNGNPVGAAPNPSSPPSGPPLSIVRKGAAASHKTVAAARRAPQGSTVTPAPLPPAVTSARIFVIALDSAGNQIINPTTFDIPISIALNLNGANANTVALNAAYAGLSSTDTGTATTSADGGTISVFSPSDQITLTLGSATEGGTLAPSVVAHYTPQGGTAQSSPALTYSVNANPPGPTYGVALSHAAFFSGITNALTVVATNGGTGPTFSNTEIDGEVDGGTITDFAGTDATYWTCTIGFSEAPSFEEYTCTVNAGSIAAHTTAPPITVNVNSTQSSMTHFVDLDDAANDIEAVDTIPVSTGTPPPATPSPVPMSALVVQLSAKNTFYGGATGAMYNASVSNNGASAATGIVMTTTLDNNLAYAGATGTNWSCTNSGQIVTCTDNATLGGFTTSPLVTINVTPVAGITAGSVSSSTAVSGGNGTVSGPSTVNTNVDYALQFVGTDFGGPPFNPVFQPGPSLSAGTAVGQFDFGGTPGQPGSTANIYLESFNQTLTNYTVLSDGCGSFIDSTAFDGNVAGGLIQMPFGTPVGLSLTVNATSFGSCSLTISSANGIQAELDLQFEQTTITVNGRKRKK